MDNCSIDRIRKRRFFLYIISSLFPLVIFFPVMNFLTGE